MFVVQVLNKRAIEIKEKFGLSLKKRMFWVIEFLCRIDFFHFNSFHKINSNNRIKKPVQLSIPTKLKFQLSIICILSNQKIEHSKNSIFNL
jgi:hypothetical protein